MIDTSDIMHCAVNTKLKLQKRALKLTDLYGKIASAEAGMAPWIKEDRLETMRDEVEKAANKQVREGLIYATLRWVLGGAEEITENDLDL